MLGAEAQISNRQSVRQQGRAHFGTEVFRRIAPVSHQANPKLSKGVGTPAEHAAGLGNAAGVVCAGKQRGHVIREVDKTESISELFRSRTVTTVALAELPIIVAAQALDPSAGK